MADDPTKILTQPGRLIWEPTDLTIASPYGGTVLGLTDEGVRIEPRLRRREIVAEEFGPEPVGQVYLGGAPRIFVTLLQWDDAAIQRAFPGGLTAAGATRRFVQLPGALGAGRRIPTGRLLFAPDDPLTNNIALFHAVAPLLDETAQLQHRLAEDTKLTLVFAAQRQGLIAPAQPEYPYRLMFVGDIADASIEVV